MIFLSSIYADKFITPSILSIVCLLMPIVNTGLVLYIIIYNSKKNTKKYGIKQFLSELKDK